MRTPARHATLQDLARVLTTPELAEADDVSMTSLETQPRAYYNASQAARYLGVSRTTIYRALRCIDPNAYPPPLEYDGRHGDRGKFHIPRWVQVAPALRLTGLSPIEEVVNT